MPKSVPIPEIDTERLRLRAWRDADVEPLAAIRADPEVGKWLGFPDPSRAAETIAIWIERWHSQGFGMWAVEELASGPFIGRVGLVHHDDWTASDHDAEIGWTLARSAWGKGYATEAATAVLNWARERGGLSQIISITRADNMRSRRVMEKLGLVFVGETRWHGYEQVWYRGAGTPSRP